MQHPPRLVIAAAFWLASAGSPAAEPAVLRLTDGGFVTGTLADSDDPKTLRWQGDAFTAPFDFDAGAVNSVDRPTPAHPPRPAGTYRFELAGGDVLFGSLVDLDGAAAVIDSPRFGPLHLPRRNLRRLDRWHDRVDLVYMGPNGLSGWKGAKSGPENPWRDDAGALFATRAGVEARADVNLPARAAVEFQMSWQSKPDFMLALGVDDDDATAPRAFRFEVWDGELVVLRESAHEADVASLGKFPARAGRVHLRAYLDQDAGRVVVLSGAGKKLADLKVPGDAPRALGGVLLQNKTGDVKLERLVITRWDGSPPPETLAEGLELQLNDGPAPPGKLDGYDPATKSFVVRGEGGESRVAEGRVARANVSPPADDPLRAVRVVLQDGISLSGDLLRVEQGAIVLNVPGLQENPRLPVSDLRSLAVLTHKGAAGDDAARTPGRLELDGVRLPGRLVDGRERPGASCLVWKPNLSANASPLRPEVSGRVVYMEPTPPHPALRTGQPQDARLRIRLEAAAVAQQRQQAARRGEPPNGMQGFFRGFAGNPAPAGSPGRRSLYLRTGDVIPAEVSRIDENGVTFESPMSDNTFVPHDKVKAVELWAESPSPAPWEESARSVRLNKPKRDRLLTLPRAQKATPPTHLIRSRNGDYLRGRVVGLDGKTLRVEVRLEEKDVPRERVSRIIWFHADELEPPGEVSAPPGTAGATRVQAVRRDGVRLTFNAERMEGATLSGKSDLLGACRVRLDDAEQVLIGGAVDREASRLAYQQWKLQYAPEPKSARDDAGPGEGRTPGTESAMVGKPAPDFELGLLGGRKFRLSESRGQVVILDFWASWCGPCLQAMPQVDQVAREFHDQGVRLVAVNLQEAPAVITSALGRLKLNPTVALDRDGLVAEKYGAHAIPQTVVIGRDGNVSRLFIGGGPHLGDNLRDALKALPAPGSAQKPKDED